VFILAAGFVEIVLYNPRGGVSEVSGNFLSLILVVLGIACLLGSYLIHKDEG